MFSIAFVILSFIVGVFVGARKPVSLIEPKKPTVYMDDSTVFISPIDKHEAFKSSQSVDDFISKLKQ